MAKETEGVPVQAEDAPVVETAPVEAQAEPAKADEPEVEEGQVSAERQYRDDAEKRIEDPFTPVVREANPNIGGESFAYLDVVSTR